MRQEVPVTVRWLEVAAVYSSMLSCRSGCDIYIYMYVAEKLEMMRKGIENKDRRSPRPDGDWFRRASRQPCDYDAKTLT